MNFNIIKKIIENDYEFIKNNVNNNNINFIDNELGKGFLHIATIYARIKIIEFFFTLEDFDINIKDINGWTSLHNAAFLSHAEEYLYIYDLLLKNGADSNILNNNGDYPYQVLNTTSDMLFDSKINEYLTIKLYEKTLLYNNLINIKQNFFNTNTKLITNINTDINTEKKVFLFGGQSTDNILMFKNYIDDPFAIELNNKINKICGYDLFKMCLNEEIDKLYQTDILQIIIVTMSYIKYNKINDNKNNIFAFAGFSLGEYSALICAGCITFDDCLKILKVRSESMMNICKSLNDGMITIIGLDIDIINNICDICDLSIANFLFDKGYVLCGNKNNINKADDIAKKFSAIKTIILNVNGSYHSKSMYPIKKNMETILNEINFELPKFKIYSNVTALEYDSVEQIKKLLVKQVYKPVKWSKIIKNIINYNIDKYYEISNNSQLKTIMKQINIDESKKFINI